MHNLQTHQDPTQAPALRLGAQHGYRIQGDVASLAAELDVPRDAGAARRDFALQLWACERPHGGGTLSGIKVAEAVLPFDGEQGEQPLGHGVEAFARPPAGQRDYAMVLVLAAGHGGAFDQICDFANYPARERFLAPQLDGELGYGIDGETVLLRAERIRNPRPADNLSGSLALELWALAQPYTGGDFEGHWLAGVELGQLAGQAQLTTSTGPLGLRRPPDGEWQLVLMLREWTRAGYVTRDYCNFASSYHWQARAAAAPVAAGPRVADRPVLEAAASGDSRVSIQTAPVEALAKVPGLNSRLAAEIVKSRPFGSIDELVRVRGIGDKTLRKLRGLLKL